MADAIRLSTINIGTLTDQVSQAKVTPAVPNPVLPTESLHEEEKLESVVEWKAVVQRYRLLHGLRIDIDEDAEPGENPATAPARVGSSFYVKGS